MILIVGLILLEAVLSVFAYSQNVRFKYLLSEQNEIIEDSQARSVDLKNRLYAVLDFQNVDQLAEQLGLVKERKPDYLIVQR